VAQDGLILTEEPHRAVEKARDEKGGPRRDRKRTSRLPRSPRALLYRPLKGGGPDLSV